MAAAVLVALVVLGLSRAELPAPFHGRDALSMVQSQVQLRIDLNSKPMSALTTFKVGDHVLTKPDCSETHCGAIVGQEVVKASISGEGKEKNTYNVHLWAGTPSQRELLDVPVEMLTDARPVEEEELKRRLAQEKAQRLAEAEEVRRRAAAQAEEKRQLQAKRKAEEQAQAEKLEADRRAAEEERLRAKEARRQAEKEEESLRAQAAKQAAEAKRLADEEMARQAWEHMAKKKALKEKWEAVKKEKLKAARVEGASPEVQRMILQSESFKELQKKRSQLSVAKTATAAAKRKGEKFEKVYITVRDADGKEVSFTVLRTTPLKIVMSKACDRFGLQRDRARFFFKGNVIMPTETGMALKMRSNEVLDVRGPPSLAT